MNRKEAAETIAMAVVKSMASAGILLGSAKWDESRHPKYSPRYALREKWRGKS